MANANGPWKCAGLKCSAYGFRTKNVCVLIGGWEVISWNMKKIGRLVKMLQAKEVAAWIEQKKWKKLKEEGIIEEAGGEKL